MEQFKTKIKNLKIIKLLHNSLKTLYKNIPWVLLVILIDIVFLFVLSGVMTVIQLSALDHLTAVMELSGQATGGIANIYEQPDNVLRGLQGLTVDEQFNFHIGKLLWYMLLMVLFAYILWVIFQGLAWWLIQRMSEKKQGFLRYMKNFTLQSLLWYFLFVLLTVGWIKAFLWVKTAVVQVMSTTTLNYIFWTLNIIVWYFGMFSYTMTGECWDNNAAL